MRGFSKISLIVVFISIICYIPSVDADQTITKYDTDYGVDQEYRVHVQTMIHDKNGQLISVAETPTAKRLQTYLPNGDHVPQWIDIIFDRTLMENYQTVIIDGKKYEKAQYQIGFVNKQPEMPVSDSYMSLCATIGSDREHTCIMSFVTTVPMMILQEGDVIIEQWTILKIIS
tara:strand:- start:111 stop:629 length:519 start_codon:yes stop_codon:yes gene_type:complete